MKYVLIIGDGMADHPLSELQGKTPLQVAKHPNMDKIASYGICGKLQTIPTDMYAGSDIAILGILGYDPAKIYTGRGPLEAAAGINLGEDDIAIRCNIITEKDGILTDYSAGHIKTEEAYELIDCLNSTFKSETVKFYKGMGYRHIIVL